MIEVFNLIKYKKNAFWSKIGFITVSLTVIANWPAIQLHLNTIYFVIFLLFLGLISLLNVISGIKNGWDIGTAIVAFPGFFISYLALDFQEPFIRIVAPILIVIFSALLFFYGEFFFSYIWKNNFCNMNKDWTSLTPWNFKFISFTFLIFLYFLIIPLHFINAFFLFSLQPSFVIDGIHQLFIGIILLLIFITFLFEISIESIFHYPKLNNKYKKIIIKRTAQSFFLTFIVFLFFDMLLETYRIVHTGSTLNWNRIFLNLGYIVIAIKGAYLHQHLFIFSDKFFILDFLKRIVAKA